MYLKCSTVHASPNGIPTLVLPEERCKSCTMDTEWVYTHIIIQANSFHHDCWHQMKSPPESHASPHCGVFSSIAPRRMRPWCLLSDKLCRDFPHVSRTKGHSESTSLLGARPKPCAHCLVLAETARFCWTFGEGFEYHELREYRVSDMESTTAGTLATFEPKRLVNGPC